MRQTQRLHNWLAPLVGGILVAWLAMLGGCVEQSDLIKSSYEVADALGRQIEPPGPKADFPVIVASFVNIDNLEQSSTLGRSIAEYVGSRFSQNGFKVIELKLRDTVYIKESGGEFLLSREVKNLSTEHEVKALVVGTYSLAGDTVYVASKVINPADATILATHDYSLKVGRNLAQMLGKR